ncbi:hypothetical protein KYK30_05455 [Shinella yambaruensis]|uniref:hypothetical protein n=1 Tax=Shinella TaxID=323620 RepID=UPI001FD2EFFA|nr:MULTISPECIES: hypothetical protein [Shinella]MCJ8024670.1 hypothetical protein [Shinella yambaruensis]MCO5138212.1 hypothetical protein [Shinella sp.]MCU7979123.1 hypothetical protein [Shinella yambaruensis]MCW5707526.1 hypothetical protein [Shinella sp.]MDC7258329.1 hypothetical protein [Shinella sp. YE25]
MLVFDMLACFRDWEDRLRNIAVSARKIANAAFVDNEWRFVGQAETEIFAPGNRGEAENIFY